MGETEPIVERCCGLDVHQATVMRAPASTPPSAGAVGHEPVPKWITVRAPLKENSNSRVYWRSACSRNNASSAWSVNACSIVARAITLMDDFLTNRSKTSASNLALPCQRRGRLGNHARVVTRIWIPQRGKWISKGLGHASPSAEAMVRVVASNLNRHVGASKVRMAWSCGSPNRMNDPYFETLRRTGDAWDAYCDAAKDERRDGTSAERARCEALWPDFQAWVLKRTHAVSVLRASRTASARPAG